MTQKLYIDKSYLDYMHSNDGDPMFPGGIALCADGSAYVTPGGNDVHGGGPTWIEITDKPLGWSETRLQRVWRLLRRKPIPVEPVCVMIEEIDLYDGEDE